MIDIFVDLMRDIASTFNDYMNNCAYFKLLFDITLFSFLFMVSFLLLKLLFSISFVKHIDEDDNGKEN